MLQSTNESLPQSIFCIEGERGSLMVSEDGSVYRQACYPVDKVVDETGAGDNYRAAFAVSRFVQKKSIQESMQIGAAAGSDIYL